MNESYDFKGEMAVNVKWYGLTQGITYAIQFVVWVVLARLLPPDNFGALGVALAFSNLVLIFGELGMGAAVIQRRDVTARHLATAFWVGVALTGIFLVVALGVSPFLADFFRNPEIQGLLVLFALKLVIDSFGAVHEVILKKDLSFQRLALIEVASSALFGIVAVVMAFRQFGIISLACGYLVKSLLKTFLLWQEVSFRPGFVWDRNCFEQLFGYGQNIIGYKIMSYCSGNIDIFLIGKFLGSAALGYYSLALNLVNFPRFKLSQVLTQVAFPAFSRIQEHRDEVCNAYVKLVRYASVVAFPLLAGMMVAAPVFVRLIYSSKWEPLTVPLQVLCVYGLSFSVTTFVGIVFNAVGRPQLSFRFSLLNFILTTVAVFAGLPFGLVGVAVALSVVSVALNIMAQLLIRPLIGLANRAYFETMLPAVACSAAMALGVLLIDQTCLLAHVSSDTLRLLAMITGGVVFYAAGLFVFYRETVDEVKGILERMIR